MKTKIIRKPYGVADDFREALRGDVKYVEIC